MAESYDIGTRVRWSWGSGTAEGEITERFTDEVTRTIKGTDVTRNATEENPAYLIEQDDGDRVIKSHSELTRA